MRALDQHRPISIILAGGQGTRLWPKSTTKRPKQFLNITGDGSLIELTANRFLPIVGQKNIHFVSLRNQQKLIQETLKDKYDQYGYIWEPSGRNTAACIFLSLIKLLDQGAQKGQVVIIAPSDHIVLNANGFQETVHEAIEYAKENSSLLTLGITPHYPHTGLGHIKKGEKKQGFVNAVSHFKEKPDLETAIEYLKTGQYLWNAGIFIGKIETFLLAFKEHCPEIYKYKNELMDSLNDEEILEQAYKKLKNISIDYAIMEKAQNVCVVEAKFDWNDIGSWETLEQFISPSKNKNFFMEDNKYYEEKSSGNLISTSSHQFVALIDIQDLLVVNTEKALLIAPKNKSQQIKKVVQYIEEQGESLKEYL